MFFKNIFYGIFMILIFSGCLSRSDNKSYYYKEMQYNSNIIYKNNVNVYKYFANCSFSKDFNPIISKFYVKDVDYLNKIIEEKTVIIFHSKNELIKMEEIINFDNIIKNIEDDIFIDNILGMVLIQFHGLQYLKNEKIMNIDNNITFSIEIWDQKSNAIPALANFAIYFIKIPK
jgi:hypothetical protein